MRRRRLWATLLGLLLVAALALLRLGDPLPVVAMRDMGFDLYQRLLPRPADDSPVRVIDIDEAALRQFGQWPWPRDRMAALTERLTALGAAAIGFDVLFAEPDRLAAGNDDAFATALGKANVALGFALAPEAPPLGVPAKAGVAISGSDPTPALPPLVGAVAPLPQLAAAAQGLGSLSLDAGGAAGPVRTVPLLWASGTMLYPSLALETLRLALAQSTIVALGDTQGGHTVDAVRVGPFTIPTTANGDLVLYDRPPDPGIVIPAARLFGGDDAQLHDEIAGRIVLVGTSASGLLDLHATPLTPSVAGVMIHAAVIDQIVSGHYLMRADWLEGLEIFVFLVAGVVLVGVVLRLGPAAGLLVAAVSIVAIIAVSWTAFAAKGWLVDATFPVFGAMLVYGAMVYFQFALTEGERRSLRRAFAHYVAPEVLNRIERHAGALRLGGEAREITVMFVDMRGFTAFTEAHTPEETLGLLNTLFGALGAEVVRHAGTIDKFIGDSIMAFWNAPIDVPDHARRAAAAALAMRAQLEALHGADRLSGVAVGIGLATGPAVVGNMGLESRFDYSAIGDSVNVASRVEGASKHVGFDIVAAEATRAAAPELAWLAAGSVRLKGKSQRLPIHILVGHAALAQSPAFLALGAAHEALLAGRGNVDDCVALARGITPRLERFYALVPERSEDFASAE